MTDQIEAVQRMQEYINAHLTADMTISDIAAAAGYSPWYARRLFIQYLGISPADHIRRLRLRRAALMLRDGGEKVLDAALDSGFESPDGFSRAFRREFGINPFEYGRDPIPIPLYVPYGVKFRFMKRRTHTVAANNVFLQMTDRPARKVIIKRGIKAEEYMEYCNEVGCDVWGILTSIKSLTGEPVCLWLPDRYITPGTSRYVQGVEVGTDYKGIVPEGFDVIELPASKYLMFQGEPFEEEDFERAIGDIWEAEKRYDPSFIGYEWDDENPRIQLEPVGTRGYIELLPVKAL